MIPDVKAQPAEPRPESYMEPSMVAIQRSRAAARLLWDEIGRLLAGDPSAPAAALVPGHRARS